MPYCVAVALMEGDVGLESFDDAHLANQELNVLTNKVKLHRDADQFLFREKNDFEIVCAYAGIEPSSFRSRLTRGLQHNAEVAESSAPIAA